MRFFWLLLLASLALGCEDPYRSRKDIPKSASPEKNEQFGSLQDVYQAKPLSLANTTPPEIWKVTLDKAATKGDANALVTIVEFSDFECPFCSRGAKTLDKLMKDYKGKLRLAFKHFPLSFHKNAHLAAQAAVEAQRQGKFWEYHDALFADIKKLRPADLKAHAKALKLDQKAFDEAIDKQTHRAAVDADLKQGGQVGVQGTPTVFVNGRKAESLTEDKVKALIDEEIERVQPLVAKGLRGDALYNEIISKGKINEPKNVEKTDDAPKKQERKVVAIGEAPTLGPDDAPVTIVEFSDFECPFCSRGANTVKKVVKAYKNKVRLAFKHFPLNFHPFAKLAAQASMAAHQQGKFWEYHDILFANTKRLDRDSLLRYAQSLDLEMGSFTEGMESSSLRVYVEEDMRQGSKLGVTGTPAFFVNGVFLNGAQPFSAFKELIDAELLKKGYKKADLPEEPADEIPTEGAPSKGAEKPLVTVVEFSDFECPFCAKAAKTLHALHDTYKEYVRFVFKQYPLNFHKNAHLAAQAALAAHEQGKFWPYHDMLFENMRNLQRPDLERYAIFVGLDINRFKQALDTKRFAAAVDADLALGSQVGVQGTPSFFIDNRPIKGASFGEIAQTLNAILLKKGVSKDKLPDFSSIPTQGAPAKGPADAPVTLVEFSDFECPFCAKAALTVNQLADTYKGKLRVVFKHYPLSFHKNAHLAAQAAMAAHEQGKFWEYHDKLFANMRALQRPDLERYAGELGLDLNRFKQALDMGIYKEIVDKDMSVGDRFGVSGTPSFFVNNKRVESPSLEELKKAVDAALAEHKSKTQPAPKAAPQQGSLVPSMPVIPPPARDSLLPPMPVLPAPTPAPTKTSDAPSKTKAPAGACDPQKPSPTGQCAPPPASRPAAQP